MKKYIIRANEKLFFDSFERRYISALLGPRRVGKTTLVDHYIQLHPERKWARFTMDALSQRNRIAQEELALMIEEAVLQRIGGTEKIWIFIDEAQKCPELFDQIKILYDTYKSRNMLKFILTGSAHLNLHKLTTESLAGRVEILNLREFNLRELAQLEHQSIQFPQDGALDIIFNSKEITSLQKIVSEIRPFQKLLEQSLMTHLLWGGLPEIIEEPTEEYRLKYLGDYLQTYMEKDIRSIDTIGDIQLYYNLLKISAEQTGSLRDDAKIIEALHCSHITLSKYRGYLNATLQYRELFPFIQSTLKRIVKSPKGYVINNGLISYLTGIFDLQILKTSGQIGHRFENWFLNEAQSWLDTQSQKNALYFWRTHAGAEIDVIIERGRQIVPCEITFSPSIQSKKINNLKNFLKNSPNASVGVYCYTGPLSFDLENKILFLPAWVL